MRHWFLVWGGTYVAELAGFHTFGQMKNLRMLLIVTAMLASYLRDGAAAEPYKETYRETNNPVRIFDWDTLKLLLATKISKVTINADSPEKLIAQLQDASRRAKVAEELRFGFKRELWEKPLSDGTVGKIEVNVELKLEDTDLLTLIRYVSALNNMTFSVEKGEIIFRPLLVG